jgi:hypothetical protein
MMCWSQPPLWFSHGTCSQAKSWKPPSARGRAARVICLQIDPAREATDVSPRLLGIHVRVQQQKPKLERFGPLAWLFPERRQGAGLFLPLSCISA